MQELGEQKKLPEKNARKNFYLNERVSHEKNCEKKREIYFHKRKNIASKKMAGNKRVKKIFDKSKNIARKNRKIIYYKRMNIASNKWQENNEQKFFP